MPLFHYALCERYASRRKDATFHMRYALFLRHADKKSKIFSFSYASRLLFYVMFFIYDIYDAMFMIIITPLLPLLLFFHIARARQRHAAFQRLLLLFIYVAPYAFLPWYYCRHAMAKDKIRPKRKIYYIRYFHIRAAASIFAAIFHDMPYAIRDAAFLRDKDDIILFSLFFTLYADDIYFLLFSSFPYDIISPIYPFFSCHMLDIKIFSFLFCRRHARMPRTRYFTMIWYEASPPLAAASAFDICRCCLLLLWYAAIIIIYAAIWALLFHELL